jgi:hypothetical protein
MRSPPADYSPNLYIPNCSGASMIASDYLHYAPVAANWPCDRNANGKII